MELDEDQTDCSDCQVDQVADSHQGRWSRSRCCGWVSRSMRLFELTDRNHKSIGSTSEIAVVPSSICQLAHDGDLAPTPASETVHPTASPHTAEFAQRCEPSDSTAEDLAFRPEVVPEVPGSLIESHTAVPTVPCKPWQSQAASAPAPQTGGGTQAPSAEVAAAAEDRCFVRRSVAFADEPATAAHLRNVVPADSCQHSNSTPQDSTFRRGAPQETPDKVCKSQAAPPEVSSGLRQGQAANLPALLTSQGTQDPREDTADDEEELLPMPAAAVWFPYKPSMTPSPEQIRNIRAVWKNRCLDGGPNKSLDALPAASAPLAEDKEKGGRVAFKALPGMSSFTSVEDGGRVAFKQLPGMSSLTSVDTQIHKADCLLSSVTSLSADAMLSSIGCRTPLTKDSPTAAPNMESRRYVSKELMSVPEHSVIDAFNMRTAAEVEKQISEVSQVHELLGEGSYSQVYRCTVEDFPEQVALKVLFLQREDALLMREAEVMKKVAHPNLVQLHMVIASPMTCFVLELCPGGCLQSVLHEEPGCKAFAALTPEQRGSALLDVAGAMQYLHSQNLVHRDVKSGNCLLISPFLPGTLKCPPLKVGDFGFAREVSSVMTQFVGTVRYMAPEIGVSSEYTAATDIFSCAILFHEISTGTLPYGWQAVPESVLILRIARGSRPPLELLPDCRVGSELKRLIGKCWDADPKKRPSADEVLQSFRELFNQ